MILSLKNYIKCLIYKLKTKVAVDSDFFEDDEFYLIDLECDKNV